MLESKMSSSGTPDSPEGHEKCTTHIFQAPLLEKGLVVQGELGRGGFGVVYRCHDQRAGQLVAVKVLTSTSKMQKHEGRSNQILASALRSKTPREKRMFCTPMRQFRIRSGHSKHLCFVYPLLGPPVGRASSILLHNRDTNPSRRLQVVGRIVVEALAALHDLDICHADFRPCNVLFDGEDDDDVSKIRVIDFGESYSSPQASKQRFFGIPLDYAAPELVLKQGKGKMPDKQIDLWSLGCTLYEIRVGFRLFTTVWIHSAPDGPYLGEIGAVFGNPPAELLGDTLTESGIEFEGEWTPLERIEMIQKTILESFNEFVGMSKEEAADLADLLEQLMRWDPETRLSARNALKHRWFYTEYHTVALAARCDS